MPFVRRAMISLPITRLSKSCSLRRTHTRTSAACLRNPRGRSSFSPPTRTYEWCMRAPVAVSIRSWIISRSRNA